MYPHGGSSLTKFWQRLLSTKSSLAKDTLFTQDELIKCRRTIRIHMFQNQGNSSNSLLTLPDVSLSPISWIETTTQPVKYSLNYCEKKAAPL